MIDFECKYVLDVPEHMNSAYWTGYFIDLVNTPTGVYARLIFVYPDNGVFDVALSLQVGADHSATVSMLNLCFSFYTSNIRSVKANARLIYDAGLNVDAASGIAEALRVISRLLAVHRNPEWNENIADFSGSSISVDDAIVMYDTSRSSSELPF